MPVIIPRTQLIRYPKHTHFCCFCLYTQTLIISTTKVSQLSFLLTLAPTLRDNYPLKEGHLPGLSECWVQHVWHVWWRVEHLPGCLFPSNSHYSHQFPPCNFFLLKNLDSTAPINDFNFLSWVDTYTLNCPCYNFIVFVFISYRAFCRTIGLQKLKDWDIVFHFPLKSLRPLVI